MSEEEADKGLERAIAGALRATIHDHGPITEAGIGSAVKRIVGNLRNARASPTIGARALARKRWEGISAEERREHQAAAARSGWANMSPEERSAEIKRRAKKRRPKK